MYLSIFFQNNSCDLDFFLCAPAWSSYSSSSNTIFFIIIIFVFLLHFSVLQLHSCWARAEWICPCVNFLSVFWSFEMAIPKYFAFYSYSGLEEKITYLALWEKWCLELILCLILALAIYYQTHRSLNNLFIVEYCHF